MMPMFSPLGVRRIDGSSCAIFFFHENEIEIERGEKGEKERTLERGDSRRGVLLHRAASPSKIDFRGRSYYPSSVSSRHYDSSV